MLICYTHNRAHENSFPFKHNSSIGLMFIPCFFLFHRLEQLSEMQKKLLKKGNYWDDNNY